MRLSNVYGPSRGVASAKDRGILNKVVFRAVRGEEISIYGDGSYLRDYVYISDVIRAILSTGIHLGGPTGVFNVGSGSATSIAKAFHLVKEQVKDINGNDVSLAFQEWPHHADPIEHRNYVANIQKMAENFRWKPTTSLEAGLKLTVQSVLDN